MSRIHLRSNTLVLWLTLSAAVAASAVSIGCSSTDSGSTPAKGGGSSGGAPGKGGSSSSEAGEAAVGGDPGQNGEAGSEEMSAGSGGTSAGGSGGTPAGGSSSAGEAGEAAEGGAAGSGDGVDPEIAAAQARAVVLIEGLESVRRCTTCHDVNYQGKGFYPNITPDVETGIGSWDAEDIKTAIHDGKDKDGETLCMTMERYDFTEAQLSDIAIYLQNLPAVSKKITVKCPQ